MGTKSLEDMSYTHSRCYNDFYVRFHYIVLHYTASQWIMAPFILATFLHF